MIDSNNDYGAERLRQFLITWNSTHPYWTRYGKDAQQVADELLQEAEFREIWLAGLLATPDGQTIEQVVASVLPSPWSADFSLMLESVKLAAAARQQDRQRAAAGWTVVAVGFAFLLFLGLTYFSSTSRKPGKARR